MQKTKRPIIIAGWAAAVALAGCTSPGPRHDAASPSVHPWTDAGFNGRKITTDHFHIFSTLRDHEFEAALPRFLESCYTRYRETLPVDNAPAKKLTTYIFGTRAEWADFTRRQYPERFDIYARIESGGFTENDTAVTFLVTRAGALATLAHEGWHQFLGAECQTFVPPWLNEGLAAYHEAVSFGSNGPDFSPRHNTFRMNTLREAIQRRRILTLREVLTADVGTIIRREGNRAAQEYYAQAWALITFLRHGNQQRHRPAFDRMMRDVADGTFDARVGSAVLRHRGADLSFSEAVLPTYFSANVDELARAYHAHLFYVAGFMRSRPRIQASGASPRHPI